MNFLFSAFPAVRSVNPHHWDSKMFFWTKLITDMCTHSDHSYMTWDNILSKLARGGRTPLGLQTVFKEMTERGEIIATATYLRDIQANETWVGWGFNWCVKKPVTWVADKVLSPIKTRQISKDMKNGRFIVLTALQKKCSLITEKFHEFYSSEGLANGLGSDLSALSMISYSKLREITSDILKDQDSLDLVLATLRKNKVIEVCTIGDSGLDDSNGGTDHPIKEKYIKFARCTENKVSPVSEADVGIVQLHRTLEYLEKCNQASFKEMEECKEKARLYIKSKRQILAKSMLRKRKRLEISLIKRQQTSINIEQLLESLNQCKTDKMILDTYRSGVAAYKDISRSNNMSAESVQETMDDVASVLDEHSDIQSALSSSISPDADSDMSLLEAEFDALMKVDGDDHKDDKMFSEINLPSVPDHTPKSANTHNVKVLLES